MIGITIDWQVPLDGAEVIHSASEWGQGEILGARSERFAPVRYASIDLASPLCVEFVNAQGRDALAAFASRRGVPGEVGGAPHARAPLALVASLRDDVEQVLFADMGDVGHVAEVNRHLQGAQLGLGFEHMGGRQRLAYRATSLAAFLLVEAAAARDAGAVAATCAHCGAVFLTGPGTGRRSTARFCSDRCRVAAARAREAGAGV